MYLHGQYKAHSITDENEIVVLIGADDYWYFVKYQIIRGEGPTAVK